MVSIYASFNDSSLFIHFIMTSKFVCFVIFSYENMLKHLKRYLESLYFFSPCLARENELLIIHSSCGSLGKHIIVSRLLFLVPYPFSEYYLSQDRKNTVEFYGLVLFPKTFLISLAESWSCMSLEKHIWFGLQPVYCTAHFFCLAFFLVKEILHLLPKKGALSMTTLWTFVWFYSAMELNIYPTDASN